MDCGGVSRSECGEAGKNHKDWRSRGTDAPQKDTVGSIGVCKGHPSVKEKNSLRQFRGGGRVTMDARFFVGYHHSKGAIHHYTSNVNCRYHSNRPSMLGYM